MKNFDEVFEDRTKYGTKIKTSEYQKRGKYAIIDQGQEQISGYTDIEEGLFEDVPVIIFGDYTRVVKYVDEPFFLGADGVKVLKSKYIDANYRYLYYALKNVPIPNTGYNRHFKWLKEVKIKYPSQEKQKNIVRVLDNLSNIINKRQKELLQFDNLIKARFVELFGDPELNPMGWERVTLNDVCSSIVRGPFGSALKKEFFVEPDETTYKVYEQKHAIQKSASIGTYYITEENAHVR